VMMEAMLESALRSAALAEEVGLPHDRIVLSAKVSGVQDLVTVYRMLAARCDYPLHLGLTEAGMGTKGIVATTAGLAIVLQEGIGDTIRVSLTPRPGGDRTEEVQVAQQVLQSLELRSFMPQVTSCPGCGRTTSTFFQQMAEDIQGYIRERMPEWRERYAGVEDMKVAVMGCVVNGPGESKHANIGISLPGTFEEPKAPVYVDGQLYTTLRGDTLVADFLKILDKYVESRYGANAASLAGAAAGWEGRLIAVPGESGDRARNAACSCHRRVHVCRVKAPGHRVAGRACIRRGHVGAGVEGRDSRGARRRRAGIQGGRGSGRAAAIPAAGERRRRRWGR